MTPASWDLLAAVAVGLGVGALIFAASHALGKVGRKPPRWVLPAAIGLAMIAYSIWADYSWAERMRNGLPNGAAVVAEGESRRFWQPWTYLAAPVTRLAIVDPARAEAQPDGSQRAPLVLLDRLARPMVVQQDFDCAGGRIRPPRSEWVDAGSDDRAFAAICKQGG